MKGNGISSRQDPQDYISTKPVYSGPRGQSSLSQEPDFRGKSAEREKESTVGICESLSRSRHTILLLFRKTAVDEESRQKHRGLQGKKVHRPITRRERSSSLPLEEARHGVQGVLWEEPRSEKKNKRSRRRDTRSRER